MAKEQTKEVDIEKNVNSRYGKSNRYVGGFDSEIADNVRYSKELKVETAWVIQRDDGKFIIRDLIFNEEVNELQPQICTCDTILNSLFDNTHYENTKENMQTMIRDYNLQNCKPVKVEIKVVEE